MSISKPVLHLGFETIMMGSDLYLRCLAMTLVKAA